MIFTPEINNNRHKWLLIVSVIVVLGSISALVAIPQLQLALKAGRETKVINSLLEIHRAQARFYATKNSYATLKELVAEGLIRNEYTDGRTMEGYNFTASEVTAKTFTIHAVRDEVSSGFRDFHIIETGDIYYLENRHSNDAIPRGQGTLLGN